MSWLARAALLAALGWSSLAQAEARRLALVIGVNRGDVARGLPQLSHAEADARKLAKQLRRHGGVEARDLVVLTGRDATRAAIFEAITRLKNARPFKSRDAVFSLFYTGHGIEDGLFMGGGDALLTAADISEMFSLSGAGLKVGFFDACHSGGLASGVDGSLPKGAQPIRFNPLKALPVGPGGTGHIFISSSGEGQRSYEDADLGGLFTHYFIEAFTQAAPERVAVDLDTLVTYAIQHTRARAQRLGRIQVPEVVEVTKRSDPIFYAFPGKPDARVILGPRVEGCVLVRHTNAQLEARVDPKDRRMAAIHSGRVDIESCAPTNHIRALTGLPVGPGDTIEVAAATTPSALRFWPGNGVGVIQTRGDSGVDLEVRHPQTQLTVHGEAGYRHSLMLDPGAAGAHGLRPVHELRLGAWMHYGAWGLGGLTAMGSGERQIGAWSYRARSVDLRGALSGALELGPIALRVDVSAGMRRTDIEFDDGRGTTTWDPASAATVGLMVPVGGSRPAAFLILDVGAEALRVNVSEWDTSWELVPVGALRVMTGAW